MYCKNVIFLCFITLICRIRGKLNHRDIQYIVYNLMHYMILSYMRWNLVWWLRPRSIFNSSSITPFPLFPFVHLLMGPTSTSLSILLSHTYASRTWGVCSGDVGGVARARTWTRELDSAGAILSAGGQPWLGSWPVLDRERASSKQRRLCAGGGHAWAARARSGPGTAAHGSARQARERVVVGARRCGSLGDEDITYILRFNQHSSIIHTWFKDEN